MLSKEEFILLRNRQFCDNECCNHYNKIGLGNIKTNSRKKGQVYCNLCLNMWVLTKGTMFFGLKTPIDKVINTLLLLVRGMGLRNSSRQSGITTDTILEWVEKAAKHSKEFSTYMQTEMSLEQVQIDEFWSYIRKKTKALQEKRNSYQN